MIVFKFGGASVKDSAAVRKVSDILSGNNENLIVVISAMGKTTNLLETVVRAYFDNDNQKWPIFQEFKNYHFKICKELFNGENIPESVINLFDELEEKLKVYPSLDYNFEYDQIVSYGELVSTRIVSEYMKNTGLTNSWIDIRTCLRTDDNFRDASVDWDLTGRLMKKVFNFKGTSLYITQGFIGSTPASLTTTLGREGSDFTAAIIGNVLDAGSVSVWKDVPGILNGDPKQMPDTIKIESLSYREAVEMTHSGAKVIHPKTMKPLYNKGIPLYVKSFVNPEETGTLIHSIDHKIDLPPIYIFREDQILITFTPIDFSFISISDIDKVINFLIKHRVKVTLMQQSAIDLNIVTDSAEMDMEKLLSKLSQNYKIRYNRGLTLVTIRYYTKDTIDRIITKKRVYLEQHSRLTARLLINS
ncbi:MAG: aspartate kinase [Prolixibacteraceae bacterium]|jgi:aspartate kinase|nr:aspartate kinase [Prolixibacteraceae bacterium]NLO01169.1 aspartate kinase [Bacteroidales bacterium]